MLNLRTDLALESLQPNPIEGIVQTEETKHDITVTTIEITHDKAASAVGKPVGTYITLDLPRLTADVTEEIETVCLVMSDLLRKLLPEQAKKILVIGLGNRNITPDALGPCVVDRVMITNHVINYLNTDTEQDFSAVCAVSPGVMGVTGMETSEIVAGVTKRLCPDVVIAVDALCAASPHRMFHTIQITDTGIHPGSGVGNRRDGLNQKTLEVPVIAVGIPTVVDSNVIVHSALNSFFEANQSLSEAQNMISAIMKYAGETMFVSPKEIDSLIAKSARMIAGGINLALHNNIDLTFAENYVS